ncbi:unnamed protein product [Brassica rapa subsp. narinosa]
MWLDCDREGENTAFEVVDVCRAVKHNLYIRRVHFSALIDREIHEAVQNLREPNQLFAQAVDARQEIDLRIGASFTRFQTMLLKDRFSIDSTGEEESCNKLWSLSVSYTRLYCREMLGDPGT